MNVKEEIEKEKSHMKWRKYWAYCPKCGKGKKVAYNWWNRKVKCDNCGRKWTPGKLEPRKIEVNKNENF